MKKITKEWLSSASDDLLTITEIINNDLLTHIVAFHAQQAIEKSFKAVIEENSLKFLKTHDLLKLYSEIENLIELDFDFEILKIINDLYTSSRYPGNPGLLPHGKPGQDDAVRFFKLAKDIYEMINKSL